MSISRVYGFVDGGYLRSKSKEHFKVEYLDPYNLVWHTLRASQIMSARPSCVLSRVFYYDADPDDDSDRNKQASPPDSAGLKEYFAKIERIPDTECRFGYLRGRPSRQGRQQKAVDVQLTVDFLVRAFERLHDIAVLLAGDADFVPLVHEVKRQGVLVIVGGFEGMSELLLEEADRFVVFPKDFAAYKLPV